MQNRIYWSESQRATIGKRAEHAPDAAVAPPQAPLAGKGGSGDLYTFTISTASIDRMGDTISVEGWNLAEYTKNPVVLWSHNASQLPIGRATRVYRENGALKAQMQFANSNYGRQVESLVRNGTLRATSVGFSPGNFKAPNAPQRKGGIDFLSGHTLLEFSIVNIPANPDCLLQREYTKAQARRNRELEIARLRS